MPGDRGRPAPRRSRRRPAAVAAALLAVLAVLLSGCSTGGSRPAAKFPPHPTTGLAQYLETPPKGSSPGKSAWARTYSPSVSAFVTRFYGAGVRTKVRAELEAQGLQDVAHVLWTTSDLVQADVVLMRFRTESGAQQRRDSVVRATEPDSTLTSYSVDERGAPIFFHSKQADAQNNVRSRAYANYGRYFVEIFMFSPIQYERGYLENWLRAQVDRLPA